MLKLLGLLSLVFLGFSQQAAAGDCQYRFDTGSEEIKVIPAGFTGLMTCSATETKQLIVRVSQEVEKTLEAAKKAGSSMLPSITVHFGNLSFYPALRSEIATTLQKDRSWDSALGKSKASSMNDPVATALLHSSLILDLGQRNLTADETSIENIKTALASEMKLPGLKGKYPESGLIRVVVYRTQPQTTPTPKASKPVRDESIDGL